MEHLYTINNSNSFNFPLALIEKEKWVYLLRAFQDNQYRSKANLYLPAIINYFYSYDFKAKTVLDIGCGFGQMGGFIKSFGAHVIGIDVIPEAVEEANKVFPTFLGRIESIPFPDSSFDIAICSMVLMLVDNVELAISDIARVLKPGATAIISILNPCFTAQNNQDETQSTSSLSNWSFKLENDDNIEVSFYSRNYNYYEMLLKRFFSISAYFIEENGSMCPLKNTHISKRNGEYLLFHCQLQDD